MLIEIDFNSDEALYVQLQNQIIMGIATATIQEGESLPSVRQLADTVGINMHTVNKAYSILKQEGFIQLDRRRGAVIAIDADKAKAYAEVKRALRIALAKGSLKNVSREEVHEMNTVERNNRQHELYRTSKRSAEKSGKDCQRTGSSICRNRTSAACIYAGMYRCGGTDIVSEWCRRSKFI